VDSLRKQLAERRRADHVSARTCRALARHVRAIASEPQARTGRRHRRRSPLSYRTAAARTELLEIAALLEHAHDPDPGSVQTLRDLLADQASPLYDPAVEAGELHATLDHVRRGLRRTPDAQADSGEPSRD
jgi:hypothetical protein